MKLVLLSMFWPLAILGVMALPQSGVEGDAAESSWNSPEVAAVEGVEWRTYAGDLASTKYSPADQITPGNVRELRVRWQWPSVDREILKDGRELRRHGFQTTPLMVGGVLYVRTSLSLVAAVDAASGRTLWVYDPKSYESGRPATFGFVGRGLAYWRDKEEEQIIFLTGDGRLIALDMEGKPIRQFGSGGQVDLRKGQRRFDSIQVLTYPSPPVICRDVIVVGSTITDGARNKEMPPGDVRGFDVRTGDERWVFHAVPTEGEYGVATWEESSWKYSGGSNVWAMMSADEELGYVYLPFTSPANDSYGGHRRGDNLFGESLVCLDAATGVRVWHFQIVHHGLWNYDLPAAPNLVDLTVEGKRIKAVAQVTKYGFCFVFDRVTGEPVWPIEEREVRHSKVPGERSAETQPFPTKPAPFEPQGMTADNLIDFTPELRADALRFLEQYDSGDLFTPPTVKGMIYSPGIWGGANWGGAAVDPETGIIYIPSISLPTVAELTQPDPARSNLRYIGKKTPTGTLPSLGGLPLVKPPYSRVTAIDLNRGEHRWMIPLGDGPREHPALKHLDLEPLGSGGRGLPLLTKTLLFVGEDGLSTPYGSGGERKLRAYDKATGELYWEFELQGFVNGAPMTYMVRGKQYIVVAIGGAEDLDALVAVSLP